MKKLNITLTLGFFLATAFAAALDVTPARAQQQLCVPFTVYGQVTDGTNPVDGANVVLTNTTTASQLQAVTEQGGFYLIETANMNPCLAVGDSVTVQASSPNFSGSQTFVHEAGALRQVNIVMSPTGPGPDTTAPVITLNGSNPASVLVGAEYIDAGATATDNADGDISTNITTTGLPVNTSAAGTFIITYSVADAAGNPAVATRTVNVVSSLPADTTPPVITIIGDNPVNIAQNTPYTDAGATALDETDGNLTANITTTGLPIDTAVAGTYTVTYAVSDTAGNAAQATRTVTVTPQNVPVPVLTTINVTPAAPTVTVGASQQFTATTLDQFGAPILATVTWSASNPAIGTIDQASGLFTALAAGNTNVIATSGGISGQVAVNVQAANPGDPGGGGNPPGGNPGGGTNPTGNPAGTPVSTTPQPAASGDVRIAEQTRKGALVTWSTTAPSETKLIFSTNRTRLATNNLKKKKPKKIRTVRGNNVAMNHAVRFTTLKKNTRYYFRIVTLNSDGSQAFSPVLVFRTSK